MPDDRPRRIEAVRRFNRFYTRQIGLLEEGLLRSPFSLTEARILYDIARREDATATALGEALGLDAGYLSRLLRGFEERGLIERRPSEEDRRRHLISLTDAGRAAFAALDASSRAQIDSMLDALSDPEQKRLVAAMRTVRRLLETPSDKRAPYLLRPHRVGDMGWVVHRHGVLYHREYGWDERFEALVARVVAEFVEGYQPHRERCWIAERTGRNVGSVFLVRHPEREGVARLRLLLVDPAARGLGIGSRLVRECARFARHAGYQTITLWTNSVLDSARRIYQAEGYRLVSEEMHRRFGPELVGQTWELAL